MLNRYMRVRQYRVRCELEAKQSQIDHKVY
jgi:hypothetical protein